MRSFNDETPRINEQDGIEEEMMILARERGGGRKIRDLRFFLKNLFQEVPAIQGSV